MAIKDRAKQKLPNFDGDGSYFEIGGTGGSTRHTGYFSDNNPYLDDMRYGANNKDIDASHERAVEWEADWYNLQEQRAYNEAMRDEQRAYDSPLADLMRKRAAGYNPDIADGGAGGAGTGSPSAGVPPMQIADQQAQSKFKNAYDDTALALQGIQVGANLLSSVGGSFQAIANGVSIFKQLPSQLNLLDAQANSANASARLSNTQTGEINALLQGKKEFQQITNGGAVLSSLLSNFDKIGEDTDITPYLNVLGVPEGEHEAYKGFIKQLTADPRQRAQFLAGQHAATKAKVDNAVYSEKYYMRVTSKAAELNELKLNCDTITQGMELTFNRLLASSNYIQDSADAAALGATNQLEEQKLIETSLKRQAEAYGKILDNYKEQLGLFEAKRTDLVKKELDTGSLTEDERAELDYLNIAIPLVEGLGIAEFEKMNGIVNKANRNAYLTRVVNGQNLQGNGEVLQHLSIHWGDFVNGAKSGNDLANEWVNTGINAISAAGGLALGFGVLNKPLATGETVTNYGYGYDGTMFPTSRIEKSYNYNGE